MRDWVVFSSSSGQTFKSVFESLSGEAKMSCRALFSDRDCAALEIGGQLLGAEKVYQYSREAFEKGALQQFEALKLEEPVVFLCGFFGILSAEFIDSIRAPIVNTHPSLLPAYPGMDKKVNRLAFENNPISGFTVHLVNEELDGGPILYQHMVDISQAQSKEESRDLVRECEQKFLGPDLDRILRSTLVPEDRNRKYRDLAPALVGVS